MGDLLEIIRREAMHCIGMTTKSSTLVATSYDPTKHAIKGVLVPSEVETGWIPLASVHAGHGYGVLVGPVTGTADNLDGDVFDVDFLNGDPNTPIAKQKHFSAGDNPPQVQSGEILIKHQTGGSTHMKADGSIVVTHKDGGQSMFDPDGNHTLNTNNKNATINSGSGSQTFAAKSQSFTADNISIKGKVALDGDLSSTGKLAGQGGVTSAGLNVRTA